MDLHKLNADEFRTWEDAKRRETEGEIRKALADIRMDIYTAKSQHQAKVRGLKRSLARLLTVDNEQKRNSAKGAGA